MTLFLGLFWTWAQSALAITMAFTIVGRCVMVINSMHPESRDRRYCVWLAFGISYAMLALGGLGSMVQIIEGRGCAGDWIWLLASTGLIVFDRRRAVAT